MDFRGAGFTPALWLLIPTFSLLRAPRALTGHASTHAECSPTTPMLRIGISNFQIRISIRQLADKIQNSKFVIPVRSTDIRVFGTMLKPRYIFGAIYHLVVSCYTLFKGWLPLSQPPTCLWYITTFYTEHRFRDLRLRSGLFPLRTWSLAPTF